MNSSNRTILMINIRTGEGITLLCTFWFFFFFFAWLWFRVFVCVHVVCNLSLCLAAREAGGRDSDREGQMETKTTVCHGCRNSGNPSFPLLHLFSLFLSPFFYFSSSFSSSSSSPPFPFSYPAGCCLSVLLFLSHPLAATVSAPQVFVCATLCFF